MTETSLERIRAFVNTLDVEHGSDELATPESLADWFATHVGPVGAATSADVGRAATMREALRAHLLANNGAELPPSAAAALDRQARRSRVHLGFGPGGAELHPSAEGVDAALGRILADASSAMADGSWGRLKACRADDCRWAFVDRSRNGSRQWCAMGVCGNRAKVRRYRARRGTG